MKNNYQTDYQIPNGNSSCKNAKSKLLISGDVNAVVN